MPDTPQPIVQPVEGGGILYDAARLSKPGKALFSIAYWSDRQALSFAAGGRGGIAFIKPGAADLAATSNAQRPSAAVGRLAEPTPERVSPRVPEWVLRHYRRGGFAARISADHYFWLGERRTRSFSEWHLLAKLRLMDLPVPAPIAARYLRQGLSYTADLLTERIPAMTLAEELHGGRIPDGSWFALGRTIARFHAAGVQHADLNANNILLGDRTCYVLDFDRGRLHEPERTRAGLTRLSRIRNRGTWQCQVLGRLKRSLEKIHRESPAIEFGEPQWAVLLQGYDGKVD